MRKTKKRFNFQSRRANRTTKQYSPIRLCSSKKTQTPVQQTERGEAEELLTSAPVGVVASCATAADVDAEVDRIADSIFTRFEAMFERLSK